MSNYLPLSHQRLLEIERPIYERVEKALKGLDGERFEQFCVDVLKEIGFGDVQQLKRGSQQGKDIIAVWHSRFVLGQDVRFRFQCKHVATERTITPPIVGADIAHFTAQSVDQHLVLLSNVSMSNDLIALTDSLLHQGVTPITGARFIRFLSVAPRAVRAWLGEESVSALSALVHLFEIRDWFESICLARAQASGLTIRRFWTEPYTWLFDLDPTTDKSRRYWTTTGGDMVLNWFNNTTGIISVEGLFLRVLSRRDLPSFGVVCTTPKGGAGILRTDCALKEVGQRIPLNKEIAHLAPGAALSSLLAFSNSDPGIYEFEIACEGGGGSQVGRHGPVFEIAAIRPFTVPDGYISFHGDWPSCKPAIEQLLSIPRDQLIDKFGTTELDAALDRAEDGSIVIRLSPRSDRQRTFFVPLMGGPTDMLKTFGDARNPEFFRNFDDRIAFVDESLDPSEPRGPLNRAHLLIAANAPLTEILNCLDKAHERAPLHPKLNVDYALLAYQLNQPGMAKFYLDMSRKLAPGNPIIAGLHYWRGLVSGDSCSAEEYVSALSDIALEGFKNLVLASDNGNAALPTYYGVAAKIAYPNNQALWDTWSNQCW